MKEYVISEPTKYELGIKVRVTDDSDAFVQIVKYDTDDTVVVVVYVNDEELSKLIDVLKQISKARMGVKTREVMEK